MLLKSVALASCAALAIPQGAVADPVIAAAGDIACASSTATATTCRHQFTSNLLVNQGLSAVLPLGDNQYESGSLSAFQSYYGPTWGRVKSITFPAVGNHEYNTKGAAGYFDYFGAAAGPRGKGYYSYDIGAWHLIALNSNCKPVGGCGASSSQGQWLKADLAAHANKCVLAYWHHPLFSSGPAHTSSVKPFWDLLYAYHADIVLNGHEHFYERFGNQDPSGNFTRPGLREFIVGTGGYSHHSAGSPQPNTRVLNTATFGVLKLTLHPTSFEWQFVPEAGATFTDGGSGICR
jgi:acid phosphatase type 7